VNRQALAAEARRLSAAGSWAQAAAAWKRIVERAPKDLDAWVSLALAYAYAGRYPDAVDTFGLAMKHGLPADAVAAGLGVTFCLRQQYDVACENLELAVSLNPKNRQAWSNLVVACERTGRVARAREAAEIVLAENPRDLSALGSLGSLYKDSALPDEAASWCERAAAAAPGDPHQISNWLWTLLHSDTVGAAAILERAREFDRRASARVPAADAALTRAPRAGPTPIRVGWLSGDLRNHAVGQFVIPVLEQLDRTRVESFVYATSHFDDEVSARARKVVHAWRGVADLADEGLARLMRQDSLDVLIDLAGHTDGSRLSALARRVAPVQLGWLGYPGTTGLHTIDHVLVPPDPVLLAGGWCSESPLALPDCYCVRDPASLPPDAPPMPWRARGHVTLGCLNNFAKVSPSCIRAWSRVLVEVPSARLILVVSGSPDHVRTDDVRARFAAHGVAGAQLDLRLRMSFEAYRRTWSELDLALDPFPFNGGTTGFDSLCAGVPFVTLRGAALHERMGANLLKAVGLEALAFDAVEAYVDETARLARAPELLEPLRQRLHRELPTSPLVDVPRFARGLEQLFATLVR
jgi:predicted O-linked N-acetylglucosamine transferase (SPINDLY family)